MEEDASVQKSPIAFVSAFFSHLDHYKRLLLRYWWVPLLTIGAGVWVQSVMLKRQPPSFVSEGRMFIPPKVSIPGTGIYNEEQANFLGTQVAIMQSDPVKDRVNLLLSHRPELHPGPVEINVTLTPKTTIFNLHATGEDADYTLAYLQATMDEYIKYKSKLFADTSTGAQSSMELKLDQLATELQQSKDEVSNFEKSNRVVFLLPNGANSAGDYLYDLKRQLNERKLELRQLTNSNFLDQNLERLYSQPSSAPGPVRPEAAKNQVSTQTPAVVSQTNDLQTNSASTLPPISAGVTNGNVAAEDKLPANLGEFQALYQQTKLALVLLNVRLDELHKKGITDDANSPDLIALKEEIAQKELYLAGYKKQSLEILQDRQHTLEDEIRALEDTVAITETEAEDANQKRSALNELKENEGRLQRRHDDMQANLQNLELNKGLDQESVSIYEPATPAVPVIPNKIKQLVMAGLVGMFLGIGIVAFIDRLDDRPRTFAEVEKLFNKPVLGQFPLMKVKNKKVGVPILQLDDARYPLVEASHSLRSALLYQDSFHRLPKDQPKSIVITSARPNDCKSMVSANFAITLAQSCARVLLIDADLRRGALHKHFSVGVGPGLAEALARQCPWSSAVVQTTIPNLDLLPCGTAPRNPGKLFAAAGRLLAEMQAAGNYDFYLFDTTPVLVGDDVLSLAPEVDGLLMVIRAGFTSGRIAQAALDLLRLRGVNVMGLVFNAVNTKTSDYYYYKYKEYYPDQPVR
jgi:succinoglycan biosynthesis transport protein ExoP